MATVLIIDDDQGDRAYAARLLRDAGHQIVAAATGIDGLRQTDFQPPDLILCDVMLPRMDGFEIVRQLRSLPGIDHVPIVAFTGLAGAENRARLLAAGFDGYIAKPVSADTLAAEIQVFLQPAARPEPAADVEWES